MFSKHSELLVASDILGITRGAAQTLAGTFFGIIIFAGLVDATTDGQLAAMYTPVGLAGSALRLTAMGALLGLVVPYATTVAAAGWGAGALAAAIHAPATDQGDYLLPLVAHVVGAIVVLSASSRIRSSST